MARFGPWNTGKRGVEHSRQAIGTAQARCHAVTIKGVRFGMTVNRQPSNGGARDAGQQDTRPFFQDTRAHAWPAATSGSSTAAAGTAQGSTGQGRGDATGATLVAASPLSSHLYALVSFMAVTRM